jgi:hypothetical protein
MKSRSIGGLIAAAGAADAVEAVALADADAGCPTVFGEIGLAVAPGAGSGEAAIGDGAGTRLAVVELGAVVALGAAVAVGAGVWGAVPAADAD